MPRYIDADALIKRIQDEHKFGSLMLSNMIAEMQTADVREVVHGEWIDVNGDGSLLECGNCHEGSCCKGNYCSNCGAKMDGEK